ncbi:CaiB/BaiF CoA transferase family protein [Chloroflexota bacterium]
MSDVTVLDLSRALPGPSASLVLADLGANVIKVEMPQDRSGIGRDLLSPAGLPPDEDERFLAHNSLARNKKSVAINVAVPAGREVLLRLLESADVMMQNNRQKVARRLQIDYATIHKLLPRLIYCNISGYGIGGPYEDRPGHAPNYASAVGMTSVEGDREGNIWGTGVLAVDYLVGLFSIIGILAALRHRDLTGQGQLVDVAHTDSAMHCLHYYFARYFRDGSLPRRNRPNLNYMRTKDGKWLSLFNEFEPHYWSNFCHAIGRDDLVSKQRARGAEWEELVDTVQEVMLTKTREEWLSILPLSETCVAPVLELDEAASDPQVLFREMVVEMEHPRFGKVRQLGIPLKLSETPGQIHSFAPKLGEHTREILTGIGYQSGELEELEQMGVIRMLKEQ